MTETVDAPVVARSKSRIGVVGLERLPIALPTDDGLVDGLVEGLAVATPADRRPDERG